MNWWLSFADDDDGGFKGAIIVPDVDSFLGAHAWVSMLGLNPGGECVGFPLPEAAEDPEVYAEWAGYPTLTLISKADIVARGPTVNIHGEPVE